MVGRNTRLLTRSGSFLTLSKWGALLVYGCGHAHMAGGAFGVAPVGNGLAGALLPGFPAFRAVHVDPERRTEMWLNSPRPF